MESALLEAEQRGEIKGMLKKDMEYVRILLSLNIPIEKIAPMTKLSIEQIRQWM